MRKPKGVEVLYRIYAHCLEGEDERWHQRMEQALGSHGAPDGVPGLVVFRV